MGNLNIVTGYRGENHVTAVDQRNLHVGIVTSENVVFNNNEQFRLDVVSANNVTLNSGDGMMQGLHFRLAESETVSLAIQNGVSGVNRNDLIVARYTKDNNTQIEEVNAVVIQGTPSSGTPSDPSINTGDIQNGDVSICDMPLWRVPIRGLTVSTPIKLFKGWTAIQSHVGQIIMSTTLDTESKVKSAYGGQQWIQLSGYVLRGATSGVTPNNNAKDLGSDTHTITEAEMPAHYHSVNRQVLAESNGGHTHNLWSATDTSFAVGSSFFGAICAVGHPNKTSGSYTATAVSAGSHQHWISAHNTNNTGSGTAMSIIPNEKNVYMWERIA